MKKLIIIATLLLLAFTAYAIPPIPGGSSLSCTTNYPVLGTGQCGSGALGSAAYNASNAFQPAFGANTYQPYSANLNTWAGLASGLSSGIAAQYIDWNASSGGNSINNKPTLGTIASQNANAVNLSGGNVTGLTNLGASNAVLTGGSLTNMTVNSALQADYTIWTVDAGYNSVLGAPNASIVVQGITGAGMNTLPGSNTGWAAGANYAINGQNITAANATGAANTAITLTGLTIGRTYLLQGSPVFTGATPTVAAVSGVGTNVIPSLVTAQTENIYFQATNATAVFNYAVAAASNTALTLVTTYEYTQPVVVRDFHATTTDTLLFKFTPPPDWNAANVFFTPNFVFDNGTIGAGNTVTFNFSGYCTGAGNVMAQLFGTTVGSSFTAGGALSQYSINSGAAAQVTIAGASAVAGTDCWIRVQGGAGNYPTSVGLVSVTMKYVRNIGQ